MATSSSSSATQERGNISEVGLGGVVVTRLMWDLVGKGYHICMDSSFFKYTII